MKYELVIFDFDGTLADTFPWFLQVVNTLADAHKFKRVEAHEVETLRGYDARMVIKHLGIRWWKMPLVANHLRRPPLQATTSPCLKALIVSCTDCHNTA